MQPSAQTPAQAPRDAGNARLRQVRTFIEQAETAQPDLMQMLLAALRGRILLGLGLGAVIGVVLALGIFFAIKPIYQSQGLMRIVARESKILYSDTDDSRVRLFDAFVAGEVNYLSSPPVLERTMAKLKAQNARDVPDEIGDLAKMVQITGQKGLVTIVATAKVPETAAFAVNDVLDAYRELRLAQTEDQQNFRAQELSAREKTLLEQLQAIDKSILDVGREYGPDAIAKEHANMLAQIDEGERRIDELTTTVNQLETVGYSLDADTGDAEIKRSMLLDNSMASMTYDRAKKAAELASLTNRYRADNPKVVTAKAEIEVLDKAIEERRAQIATLGKTGALTQGGQKEKQSVPELKALLKKLTDRRDELKTEALDLNSRMVKLAFLKEERGQVRAHLDQTRGALEEVRVESRNAMPGVTEVVSRGSVADRPAEDKRKAMAMVGFIVGLGMGIALVALWGLLRPTVRSERDLTALGSAVAPAGTFASVEDPVHSLRNMLHLALSRHEQQRGGIVAVIGAGRDQGVTTLARALARSFHHAGARTALVDGHLGNPDLSEMTGTGQERGFADWILSRRQEELPLSFDDGITILPAGSTEKVLDHALSPHDVRGAMEHLADAHDVVIADCGAAKQVLSSTLFAAHCDAVLMVLRRGTPLADARSATAAVLATSRKQVLVVLTGAEEDAIPPWLLTALLATRRRATALALAAYGKLQRKLNDTLRRRK